MKDANNLTHDGTPPSGKKGAETARMTERLDQIEAIFLEQGFRSITVDELAARLRCSKRSLYELAPSKMQLARRIVARELDRVRHEGLRSLLEHDDPGKRLTAFIRPGFMQAAIASPDYVRDVAETPQLAAMVEAHQRERMDILCDLVEDGIRRGRFRKVHPRLVADIYLAAISMTNKPAFLDRTGMSLGQAFEETFKLIAYGLWKTPGSHKED